MLRFNSNLFSNRIAKFLNRIANWIAPVQIEYLRHKSNRQNGSNRDLNPNCDWVLPITVIIIFIRDTVAAKAYNYAIRLGFYCPAVRLDIDPTAVRWAFDEDSTAYQGSLRSQ